MVILSCFFDGKCDITPITRKFCQKCRLSKCFAVGMKKDWILTEYEKIMKRKKVEENRRKRRLIENIYNNNINNNNIVFKTDYSVSDSHSCEIIPTQSPDNSRVIDTSNQSEYEISNVWTPDSEDTPNDNTMISHEAIDQHIINDSIVPRLADQLADKELFLSNQQKFKLSTVSIVRHISNFSISFNEFEINKIRELLTALKWIREPTGNTVIAELDDPVQYKMTMAARFNTLILNFIQMTKQLNPFNNLCGNDMIALIKYGCIENLLMRSLEYYNPKDRYWTINTDHNSSLLLKLDFTAKCEPFLGDCYIRYFDIMCPEWDSDELIMDLLTAIVLFDPNRPNLKYRDT
ncbi:unnamed protein product [Medioppia subpectinata]|uniref:NR LBD domain-containing protein n=1 Tax=Medioppia subpectinata TaxID=1979941 RepID=A0A7R9KQ72_9ACAR|nr:unnamed protein product [Medioppia subpectinata]CAG2107506.1 unnamed protein product [Medioppia subpectinata]